MPQPPNLTQHKVDYLIREKRLKVWRQALASISIDEFTLAQGDADKLEALLARKVASIQLANQAKLNRPMA